MDNVHPVISDIRDSWNNLRQQNPKVRIRDAANMLGVSEAELLATDCGYTVTKLTGDWGEMLQSLPDLGHIMALTRNDHAVHERKGYYRNVSVNGQMGLVLDEEIDLRVFLGHWHFGFAVQEEVQDGIRRSLQFFDRDGVAVHKIFLQDDARVDKYAMLVDRFRSQDQSPRITVESYPEPEPERPEEEIDFEGLYGDWRDLQDTHDFFGMLKKFKVTRMQALRRASADLARQVPANSLRGVLEMASARGASIMIFVNSPGVIQIHTGTVERIVPTGPWINVLDPRFNLHLREDAIASAWIVRKPTRDGIVTSLEIFDNNNEMIALLFGKRKPGVPESEEWREIVATIENGDGPTEKLG